MNLIHKSALVSTFCLFCLRSNSAQTPNLSADDTVAYINATLHKYPTAEFIASGCSGYEQVLSISGDRRSLIIRVNYGYSSKECQNIRLELIPVFSLHRDGQGKWYRSGQHSEFSLRCDQARMCVSGIWDGTDLRMTAPDELSDRLTRAIQHLPDQLLADANSGLDKTILSRLSRNNVVAKQGLNFMNAYKVVKFGPDGVWSSPVGPLDVQGACNFFGQHQGELVSTAVHGDYLFLFFVHKGLPGKDSAF